MALIELSGIERRFLLGDTTVHALAGLNLQIEAGEYVAVMGPSGSGKSTLLNLLGLLDPPNEGTYKLEGRDVTTLSPDEQATVRSTRIGFVFQSFHLVPRLTAAENIALPMTLAGIPVAERNKRVTQALKDFGLDTRADHKPDQLSGGQRQRVAIALNAKGVTLIVVTHDQGMGARAKRQLVMEDGRLKSDSQQSGISILAKNSG